MDLLEIQQIIEKGDLAKAKSLLDEYIAKNKNDDKAYFLLGNIYRRSEDWQNTINSFQKAIDINPESPAVAAKENIYKILNFFDKNLYNQ